MPATQPMKQPPTSLCMMQYVTLQINTFRQRIAKSSLERITEQRLYSITLFNCYANWRQNIYKINKETYLLDLSHRTASSEKWLSFSRGTLCSCVPPFECLWKRRLAKPSSLWSAVAVPVHWLQGTSFWAAIYMHWRLLEKQNRKY